MTRMPWMLPAEPGWVIRSRARCRPTEVSRFGTSGYWHAEPRAWFTVYWHQRGKTRHCMRGEWFFTGDRYPHLVRLVTDFPRTSTGKIQRYELRDAEVAEAELDGRSRSAELARLEMNGVGDGVR